MKKLFWTLSLITIFSLQAYAQNIQIQELLDAYQLTLPENAEVSIAIVADGSSSHYGYKIDNGRAMPIENQDHIFEIGSISKTFTGALVMKEVDNEKIRLSASINEYLDQEVKNETWQDVTIQQLMTHTSGLATGMEAATWPYIKAHLTSNDNPHKFMKWKHYKKYLRKGDLVEKAGSVWRYNNSAIGLLGVILESSSHDTWENLIKDNLLEPNGMSNTYASYQLASEEDLVQGYDLKGRPAINWDMDFINPAGSILSTSRDMVKWVNAHLNAPEGSALDKMKDSYPDISISKKSGHMGNIWWHKDGYQYHGGATGAFRSFLAFDDASQTGVVILVNYSAYHPGVRAEDGSSIQRNLGFALMDALKKEVALR